MKIAESELILNKDGSVYHLTLLPEDIADTIITVGDPERVPMVTKYFDKIEIQKSNREFVTHTGYLGNKKVSVIATGIGSDNIDIVLNESDALVNIDLKASTPKKQLKSLNIIRIGTSGALQNDIPIDSFLVSEYAVGLEGLLHFYQYQNAHNKINNAVSKITNTESYTTQADTYLLDKLAKGIKRGITLTAPGFYAPQGRQLRLQPKQKDFIDTLSALKFEDNLQITNLEMETSGIYGLGSLLGHRCISFNAMIANRQLGTFSSNAEQTIDELISFVLENIKHL